MWIPFKRTRNSIHYVDSLNPLKRKAIFFMEDPKNLDPLSTFNAEDITGYIWRWGSDYPPTENQLKNLGAGIPLPVGQYQSGIGLDFLHPNANGDLIQWNIQFPLAGQHWDKLTTPDDDATYIKATGAAGAFPTDLLQIDDTIDHATVTGVVVLIRCRNEVGTRWFFPRIKTHGVVYIGGGFVAGVAWMEHVWTWANNPFTGAPWTLAEINALQAGVAVQFPSTARCTRVRVEVDFLDYYMYRGFASFDTSTLPDAATIDSSKLFLAMVNDLSTVDFDMHFYSGLNQWIGEPTLDWPDCLVDEGVFFNTAGKALDTYYNHSVLASSINKTGKTQFRLKTDREGTKPAFGTNEYIRLYGSGTAFKPYLEVNYTVPAAKPLINKPLVNPILINPPITRFVKNICNANFSSSKTLHTSRGIA